MILAFMRCVLLFIVCDNIFYLQKKKKNFFNVVASNRFFLCLPNSSQVEIKTIYFCFHRIIVKNHKIHPPEL